MYGTMKSKATRKPVTSVARKDQARNRKGRGSPTFGSLQAKASMKGRMGSQ